MQRPKRNYNFTISSYSSPSLDRNIAANTTNHARRRVLPRDNWRPCVTKLAPGMSSKTSHSNWLPAILK